MSLATDDPLANPVWHALTGRQADSALGAGDARTYRREVARFSALREPSDAAYRDLARLLHPGDEARLFSPAAPQHVPPGWETVLERPLLQLVAEETVGEEVARPDGLVRLGPEDGEEMLALATLTHPGPFERDTVRLGGFIGIRRDGRLVAMAGHRLKLPGHTEVSGICTDPEHRGRGLARTLTLLVMRGIREAGEIPMLHAFPDNGGALALYRRLGFRVRRELTVRWLQPPD